MKVVNVSHIVYEEKYETSDGLQFINKHNAELHEQEIEERKEKTEKYEIITFDKKILPLEEFANGDSCFTWYKVENIEQFEDVVEVFKLDVCKSDYPKENEFPFIFYVEDSYGDMYYGTYNLSVANAKRFFEAFGYEMILKEINK